MPSYPVGAAVVAAVGEDGDVDREPVAGLVELATKRVTARVQRTPLWPARRLAKWKSGLMWPWDGYGRSRMWML